MCNYLKCQYCGYTTWFNSKMEKHVSKKHEINVIRSKWVIDWGWPVIIKDKNYTTLTRILVRFLKAK